MLWKCMVALLGLQKFKKHLSSNEFHHYSYWKYSIMTLSPINWAVYRHSLLITSSNLIPCKQRNKQRLNLTSLHHKLNLQPCPDTDPNLFLTPDWGGDQGLPGLPADCIWGVWLHIQTQPVHKTREVLGGPRCLGPSRKGNLKASCFSHMVENVNSALTKSHWRIKMLIYDIKVEILEPLHRQQMEECDL